MSEVIKCYRCEARYSKGGWIRARDLATGTEPSRYVKTADIPDDHCPICNQPPILTPKPVRLAM